ncbi:MAG TPA: hypothetical protein PK323_12565 [Bacteroidia bacterium]|nr:hypothetical protein [Bacteroidia bacterium]
MKIKVKGEIIIPLEGHKVFSFIANLENDKLWRKEINYSTINGEIQLGTVVKESSYLSKRVPENILELICTEFNLNHLITYTTIENQAFYLQSKRIVIPFNTHQSKFIYEIIFDKSLVKHGIGFNLPNFLIKMVAQSDMNKYLKKLKQILEANSQN